MTSFGGVGGWLAASAYLHHLTPPIPGRRLLVCWLAMAAATALVARGKRRPVFLWGLYGLLFGAPALVVAVVLGVAPKRSGEDAGSV